MRGLLEHKQLGGTITDVDTKNRVIVGYGAKFGNMDSHRDIIEPGAFTKTLNENRGNVYFLNQHSFAQPHGKMAVLQEDNYGLKFESEPMVKGVSYSDDALKLMEAGIIDSFSVGYITKKEQMDKDVRLLKELALYEISNVTIPANPGAKLTGIKSLTMEEVDAKVKLIVKMLRHGDLTDESFRLLELGLKDLQASAYELGKKALNEDKPFEENTYADVKPHITTINDFLNKF